MKLKKPTRRLVIILTSVLFILIIAVLVLNAYLGSIIEGKIREALNNNKTKYIVSLRDVKFNIISGNLKVYDLSIEPDSTLLDAVKNGNAPVNMVEGAEIPEFKIAGIGYYQALVNRNFVVRKIELSDAHVIIYRGAKPKYKKEQFEIRQQFSVDSIYIEKLGGINLKKFIFSDCKLEIFDLVKDDYVLQTGSVDAELTGMDLVKRKGLDHVFMLGFYDFKMEVSFDEFKLPGGWYNLGIDKLTFNMPDSSFLIRDLKFWPQYDDLNKMAKDQKFTKEIYDVSIDEIKLYHCNMTSLVQDGSYFIDSVLINGLNIDILKDKRYPFNENLRPKLPHQLLKTMNVPLNIPVLRMKKSNLKYQEKNEGEKDLMTVTLNKINTEIKNITTLEDSIKKGKILEIHLTTRLMDKAVLDVQFAMPLRSSSDTMFFTGHLGATPMKPFNRATIPALGLKIVGGKINNIDFKGAANAHYSSGEMTMTYENLEGEVYKKDVKETNKFMTWVANKAVRNNNPGKNGKLRVARMEFERVMYKGFGNFMWKTLQSGIVNTVSPTGKYEAEGSAPQNENESKSKSERRRSKNKE